MKEKFAGMAVLLIFVIASCNRSDTIQRQEEYSDEVFKENKAPDNVVPQRGSTETDAVGTEDAVVR